MMGCSLTIMAVAQSQNALQVATWPGFKDAAITYTFDDGTPNQFALAVPMFNEFGYPLTLFLVPQWVKNWDDVTFALTSGHEIASHSVTHPNLSELSAGQQEAELRNAKDTLEARVPGLKCLTIAYPYCVPGIESICQKYYLAARHCQGNIEQNSPASFYNISSIGVGSLGRLKTSADLQASFESAKSTNGWCILLLHGVDNDGGYSPLPSTDLRASLEYLKANAAHFWVATFAQAAIYIQQRNAVTITKTQDNKNHQTFSITDTLPNAIYNQPLSLQWPLPAEWKGARVLQNNTPLSSIMVNTPNGKYLQFEAYPDKGQLDIEKQ